MSAVAHFLRDYVIVGKDKVTKVFNSSFCPPPSFFFFESLTYGRQCVESSEVCGIEEDMRNQYILQVRDVFKGFQIFGGRESILICSDCGMWPE